MNSSTLTPQVGNTVIARLACDEYKPLEVERMDDLYAYGRIPYASTYTSGGFHEGEYRGSGVVRLADIVEIAR